MCRHFLQKNIRACISDSSYFHTYRTYGDLYHVIQNCKIVPFEKAHFVFKIKMNVSRKRAFQKIYLIFRPCSFNVNIAITPTDSVLPDGCLHVHYNAISESDEKVLYEFLDPILSKRRYQGDHWDDVISAYKETEINFPPPPNIQIIFDKQINYLRTYRKNKIKIIFPHVIDLDPNGHIGKFHAYYLF